MKLRESTLAMLCAYVLSTHLAFAGDLLSDLKRAPLNQFPSNSPIARGAIQPAVVDSDGLYVIRIGALTTRAYDDEYGNDELTQAEVQRLVDYTNDRLAASEVPVVLELIDVQRYSQIDETTDPYRVLEVAASEPRVQAWRDHFELDQVAILRNSFGCSGLVGLASGFNGFQQSDPPEHINTETDAFFLSSNGPDADGVRCPDWLFSHEFGHNLSAGHAWAQHTADQVYWKTYAHGFRCSDDTGQSNPTIMRDGVPGIRIDAIDTVSGVTGVYSSPDVAPFGQPCGTNVDFGAEALQANNARAMTEAAPYVANYR